LNSGLTIIMLVARLSENNSRRLNWIMVKSFIKVVKK